MRPKVFLDSNVLLDMLVQSRFSADVDLILSCVKSHEIEAQITTQSLIDIEYISHRLGVPFEAYEQFLQAILAIVNISEIDSFDLRWAASHRSGDFEDDAQVSNAYDGCCDWFITHDKKLLSRDDCPPMAFISPEDFVARLRG